jgi:hypothetical protein
VEEGQQVDQRAAEGGVPVPAGSASGRPAPVELARLRSEQPAEGDVAVRRDPRSFRRYTGCRNVAAAGHNASAFGHNEVNAALMHNWAVADPDAA